MFKTLIAIAMLALVAQPATTNAETPLKAATLKLYPWGFFDEAERPTGLLFAATNAIIDEAGLTAANRIMPMRRAMQDLADGEIDLLAFFIVPQLSDVHTHRVGRIAEVENVVIGRRGLDLETTADLAGLSVAEPLGYMNDQVPESYRTMNRVPVRDYTLAVGMLAKRRVDVVAGPFVALRCAAAGQNFAESDFGRPLRLFTVEIWLQMSRKSEQTPVLERLRAAAERLQARGAFDDLFGLIDCSK